MKILVCGSRDWTNNDLIEQRLSRCPSDTVIVEGGARGADSIAAHIGRGYGFLVREYPADWDRYGPSAGPIRNQEMLDKEHPDLVLAFHEDLRSSRGTKDMVLRAQRALIPVEVIDGKEPSEVPGHLSLTDVASFWEDEP